MYQSCSKNKTLNFSFLKQCINSDTFYILPGFQKQESKDQRFSLDFVANWHEMLERLFPSLSLNAIIFKMKGIKQGQQFIIVEGEAIIRAIFMMHRGQWGK